MYRGLESFSPGESVLTAFTEFAAGLWAEYLAFLSFPNLICEMEIIK